MEESGSTLSARNPGDVAPENRSPYNEGMILRSELSLGSRWIGALLGLPLLGASVLSAIAWQILPDIENDEVQWLNHPLVRAALGMGLLAFAVWLSSRLSQVSSRVELDGMALLMRPLCGGRIRRESLGDLKAIHPDGRVEFVDGRTVHLGDHPLILDEVRWWQANGFRHPHPGP